MAVEAVRVRFPPRVQSENAAFDESHFLIRILAGRTWVEQLLKIHITEVGGLHYLSLRFFNFTGYKGDTNFN